jgi:hypothetical protein
LKAKGVYSKRLINFQGVILYMKLSTEQVWMCQKEFLKGKVDL